MLFSGLPFAEVWGKFRGNSFTSTATQTFVRFLEQRLGGRFIYERSDIPFGRADLIDLFEIAETLRHGGVIKDVHRSRKYPDEPPFFQWAVTCNTDDAHTAGGVSLQSDRDALVRALAEATERFLWMTAHDHLSASRRGTVSEMRRTGNTLSLERFAGFSAEQREKNPHLGFNADTAFLWTRGRSHATRGDIWIPTQVVSGALVVSQEEHHHEPMILFPITTGLATGPSPEFALLNGALEIIERDAFMITWLNQITPPRVDLDELAKADPEIASLRAMCTRYRLSLSAVSLPTDAPAHVVCAVVTDETSAGPGVSVGLKAHRSLAAAVKGSCLEALRIRQTIRHRDATTPLDPLKPGSEIVHLERAQYWGRKGADGVRFLIEGAVTSAEPAVWENDTVEQHWQRIVAWCRDKGYECASVDVGKSARNVSPWHVAMVVMPELQPMHQTEKLIYLGGDRLREVPKQFGYKPRATPFTDEPHPFA